MSKIKRLWYEIRVKLIKLLAGNDMTIVTNTVVNGTIYPRGSWMLISSNFIMANSSDKESVVIPDPHGTESEKLNDKTNVDSNA
mgnify:CR=1 FL=1